VTPVRVETNEATGLVVLDRPERLNALDVPMVEGLLAALERLAGDPGVRVVILTGAGRGFCAGGDMAQMATGPPPDVPMADQIAGVRRFARIAELLRDMPKPTIAAVNGPCAGAGMSLACAADVRYAARTALFTTAFARAGQSGDYGLGWTLPRLLGEGRARELLLLGDRVDAVQALGIGLVTQVVGDDELLPLAQRAAATLAAMAPLTLAAIKANLSDGQRFSFSDYLDREADRFIRNGQQADAREAAIAFNQKRPARFGAP
jgi:2-(1,2-epoxy-1,2-dihydrophenyl)acetyl-CoA isomerase